MKESGVGKENEDFFLEKKEMKGRKKRKINERKKEKIKIIERVE